MAEDEDDRRVTRRSNDECRRIANSTKSYYRTEKLWPVNIGRILRSGSVLTVQGQKKLIYDIVDDSELGIKDAKTELVDHCVRITAKKSIDSLAGWGDGRARMTLAHELGHAVMHAEKGAVDHRATGASGTTTLSKFNASESAEHQAKVFASAFLINDSRASELSSPLDIATEFLVSLSAAEICYERIVAERERAESAARVLEASRKFQELVKESERPKKRYLQAHCISCKSQRLVPLGIKVECEACGYFGDHPEDN